MLAAREYRRRDLMRRVVNIMEITSACLTNSPNGFGLAARLHLHANEVADFALALHRSVELRGTGQERARVAQRFGAAAVRARASLEHANELRICNNS